MGSGPRYPLRRDNRHSPSCRWNGVHLLAGHTGRQQRRQQETGDQDAQGLQQHLGLRRGGPGQRAEHPTASAAPERRQARRDWSDPGGGAVRRHGAPLGRNPLRRHRNAGLPGGNGLVPALPRADVVSDGRGSPASRGGGFGARLPARRGGAGGEGFASRHQAQQLSLHRGLSHAQAFRFRPGQDVKTGRLDRRQLVQHDGQHRLDEIHGARGGEELAGQRNRRRLQLCDRLVGDGQPGAAFPVLRGEAADRTGNFGWSQTTAGARLADGLHRPPHQMLVGRSERAAQHGGSGETPAGSVTTGKYWTAQLNNTRIAPPWWWSTTGMLFPSFFIPFTVRPQMTASFVWSEPRRGCRCS